MLNSKVIFKSMKSPEDIRQVYLQAWMGKIIDIKGSVHVSDQM